MLVGYIVFTMKNIRFLLAEQIGASCSPLDEIDNLRRLLDSLEKIYKPREKVYDEIRPSVPWWKKRWVIHWRKSI